MSLLRRNRRSRPRPHPPYKPKRRLRDVEMVASVVAERPDGTTVTVAIMDPWMRFYHRPGYAMAYRVGDGEMYIVATRLTVIPIEVAYRTMILMQSVLKRSDIQDVGCLLADCRGAAEFGDIHESPQYPAVSAMLRRLKDTLGPQRLNILRNLPIEDMPGWVRERIKAERPL